MSSYLNPKITKSFSGKKSDPTAGFFVFRVEFRFEENSRASFAIHEKSEN